MAINVTFTTRTGRQIDVEAQDGDRLLDAALDSLVPGIIGQCGGGVTCATCHVKLDSKWLAKLPEAEFEESGLLDYVSSADEFSRLACQIRLTGDLDGLEARVPTSE